MARRFESELDTETATDPARVPKEFLPRLLHQLPDGIREQVELITPQLLGQSPSIPGCFGVLANSINIMQDDITRARLAGDPPQVMLLPGLRRIKLMDFNRAHEAIAEGRLRVEEAMPMLKRFV